MNINPKPQPQHISFINSGKKVKPEAPKDNRASIFAGCLGIAVLAEGIKKFWKA